MKNLRNTKILKKFATMRVKRTYSKSFIDDGEFLTRHKFYNRNNLEGFLYDEIEKIKNIEIPYPVSDILFLEENHWVIHDKVCEFFYKR